MRYRALSPGGDYSFGNGLLNFYIDVPQAVEQAVQTRLTLWLGEWYQNTLAGTPYLQGVLGTYSQAQADRTIQDIASNTQGFVDYQNYESVENVNTRGYSASFDLDTIYGPTSVQIANYRNY